MNDSAPRALVTGAARRVGRAVTIELARAGFDLSVTYHQNDESIAETVALARDASGRADFSVDVHQCDFAMPDEVRSLAMTVARAGRLDALVLNASSYAQSRLADLSDDELIYHYRVNAASAALLSAILAPRLADSPGPGGGSIVAFSDIHVHGRPRRNYLAYAMSKAAVAQMIETLAIELAPRVRVNGIAPGVVAWPDDVDAAEIAAYEERIPLNRPGTPDDAARLVRWLVCEATYITGEIVRLDGGRWLL